MKIQMDENATLLVSLVGDVTMLFLFRASRASNV